MPRSSTSRRNVGAAVRAVPVDQAELAPVLVEHQIFAKQPDRFDRLVSSSLAPRSAAVAA